MARKRSELRGMLIGAIVGALVVAIGTLCIVLALKFLGAAGSGVILLLLFGAGIGASIGQDYGKEKHD